MAEAAVPPPRRLQLLLLALTLIGPTTASKTCPTRLPDGQSGPANYIVGGDLATTASASYTASIINSLTGACTAFLVSSTWALTAAHCRPTNATFFFSTGSTRTSGPLLRVRRTILFDPTDSENQDDIALIELADPAPRNATFLLVNDDGTVPATNEFVRSVGFGITRFRGLTDGRLRQVDVPATSNEYCKSRYKRRVDLNFDNYLCAGYVSGRCGGCSGDSGGPAVAFTADGRAVAVGIASRSIGCAFRDTPMLYSRVSVYVGWMRRVGAKFDTPSSAARFSISEGIRTTSSSGGLATWGIALVAGVPIVLFVITLVILLLCARRARKRREVMMNIPSAVESEKSLGHEAASVHDSREDNNTAPGDKRALEVRNGRGASRNKAPPDGE